MALTVILLLGLAAFITTILSAMSKCPLWVPVMLLCLIELLRGLPL